jgi:hypothetical protein
MMNSSLTTDSIIMFVKDMNQKAMKVLDNAKGEADIDIKPLKEFNKKDMKKFKLEDKYKIQQGAAQGMSICKRGIKQSRNGPM